MNELYWITRLDAINMTAGIAIAIGAAALIAMTILYLITNGDENEYAENCRKKLRKAFKKLAIFFAISLLVFIFTPDRRDALLIYGVGGTIDYIKSNDKAKEIPDKVVDALTRYVDSIEKKDTNGTD